MSAQEKRFWLVLLTLAILAKIGTFYLKGL